MALVSPAYACTGVIVGGDLTEDGSTIFGRTEDLEPNHPKHLEVHPAGEFPAGSKIVDTDTGATWVQQRPSLGFTSISDAQERRGEYRFDEAGFNSAGVAVDATVSASANAKVVAVDPYRGADQAPGGWEESTLTTVLLANATSAREGVDLMARMVAQSGMAEGDILVIADKNELWYMELYTGHQYAAMKYPRDRYSVFPNAYWLNRVDCQDTNNYVCSPDLEKVARQAQVYTETDGHFDPAASYNPPNAQADRNASRVWSGLKVLDPGNPATASDATYPLLNAPSKQFTKVNLQRVFAVQRNRFQGVDDKLAKLSLRVARDSVMVDKKGNSVDGAAYPIGNTNTMEAHVFVLPPYAMPATVPGTMWVANGSPIASPYLPMYGNITSTIEPMRTGANSKPPAGERLHPALDDPKSYFWTATALAHKVEADRASLERPVGDCLRAWEAELIAKRGEQDRTLAAKYAKDPGEAAQWATSEFASVSSRAFGALKAMKAAPTNCPFRAAPTPNPAPTHTVTAAPTHTQHAPSASGHVTAKPIPSGGHLSRTGATSGIMALIAAGVVGAGVALVAWRRTHARHC